MKKLLKKIAAIPHLFAKCTIIWCVLWGTGYSGYALHIEGTTGTDVSTTLGIVLGFLGGELLILCLRTIFKADKSKEEDTNETI